MYLGDASGKARAAGYSSDNYKFMYNKYNSSTNPNDMNVYSTNEKGSTSYSLQTFHRNSTSNQAEMTARIIYNQFHKYFLAYASYNTQFEHLYILREGDTEWQKVTLTISPKYAGGYSGTASRIFVYNDGDLLLSYGGFNDDSRAWWYKITFSNNFLSATMSVFDLATNKYNVNGVSGLGRFEPILKYINGYYLYGNNKLTSKSAIPYVRYGTTIDNNPTDDISYDFYAKIRTSFTMSGYPLIYSKSTNGPMIHYYNNRWYSVIIQSENTNCPLYLLYSTSSTLSDSATWTRFASPVILVSNVQYNNIFFYKNYIFYYISYVFSGTAYNYFKTKGIYRQDLSNTSSSPTRVANLPIDNNKIIYAANNLIKLGDKYYIEFEDRNTYIHTLMYTSDFITWTAIDSTTNNSDRFSAYISTEFDQYDQIN